MRLITTLTAAALTLGLATFATPAISSAFTNAEDAVEYRQSAFKLIRENFGYMSGMVRGEIDFDAEQFQKRSKALVHLSNIPFDAFTGAGENATNNSDALPAIWQNWSDFESKRDAFQSAALELAEAAESGNVRDIRPKFMATARTCQQCHEGYRAD
ncbi:MAG: cytochrome c [Gammaproteobacteria bacterium]|nr:cytochrome c [Gammaproteobacteria bacterium]